MRWDKTNTNLNQNSARREWPLSIVAHIIKHLMASFWKVLRNNCGVFVHGMSKTRHRAIISGKQSKYLLLWKRVRDHYCIPLRNNIFVFLFLVKKVSHTPHKNSICQESDTDVRSLITMSWCWSCQGRVRLFHPDPTLITRPKGKSTKCSPQPNQDQAWDCVIHLGSVERFSIMNKGIVTAYWNLLIAPKTPHSTVKACVDVWDSSDTVHWQMCLFTPDSYMLLSTPW